MDTKHCEANISLGGPLQPGGVVTHHFEVFVQAVEPVGDPAQPTLEEADAERRIAVHDAPRDHVHYHRHLAEGMRDHVVVEDVSQVAIAREALHLRAEAPVDGDGQVVCAGDFP